MNNRFRLLALLIIIVIQSSNYSNSQTRVVNIPLETKTNVPTSYCLTRLYENRSALKGIPQYMNDDNSLVKYYPFKNDTLFMLIGDVNDKERLCVIDVNKNKDFSDDYKYYFDSRNLNCRYSAQPVILKSHEDQNKFYFISPSFTSSAKITYNQKNELQQKYVLLLGINMFYKGIIHIDNNPYVIIIKNDLSYYLGKFEYLLTDSVKFNEDRLGGYDFHEDKDPFLIDSLEIKPISISDNRTNIDIQITNTKNIKKNLLRGFEEGFYARSISIKDLYGKDFKLDKLKGKYVLLDFWGTWCNPCIALLPNIASIHKQYPELEIVSIAREFKEDDKNKISNFVKKYEMEWVNICDFPGKDDIVSKYKISSFPTTILIDPNGKIIHRGSSDVMEILDKKLENVFHKK